MPMLHIQLLGAFQVTVEGQPWDDFRSDKVRALLAYLVLEGAAPRRRSQLMALLWPGFKPTFARANLRMTLANLRQLLTPFGLLQTTRQAVRWYAPEPNWTCDVLLLEQLRQDRQRAGAELWQTLDSLYQGEFLPGFEQIDSLPWQLWLQEKRTYYAHYAEEARNQLRPSRTTFGAPDWGAIPRTPQFYGRLPERSTLRQWLVDERCHLVAIFGLGGQGKTTLTAVLAHELTTPQTPGAITVPNEAPLPTQPSMTTVPASTPPFGHVIWRSLRSKPSLREILLSWLQSLANQQITHLPALVEDQLALLIRYLQAQPTLLVLDNLESILQSEGHAGRYQAGYEAYSELWRRVAASDHQSCLVMISREQPQEFHRLQTQEASVRALHLRGLEQTEALQLIQGRGLRAPTSALSALVQRYAGHPLALQVALETIQEFFGGRLADFIAQAPLILADLRTTLEQDFARLSALEQTILIWLALEDSPVTRQVLLSKLIKPPPLNVYLEAERSLLRRFQIEIYGERLGLQSLMQAYLADYLATQIYLEIKPASDDGNGITQRSAVEQPDHALPDESGRIASSWSVRSWVMDSYLNRYQLDQVQTNTYPNKSQGSLILHTVAQQLVAHFGLTHVFAHLNECLNSLYQEVAPLPGYAITNLIYLLRQLGVDASDLASSDISIGRTEQLHPMNHYH